MRRIWIIGATLLALLSPAKAADSTVSAMTAAGAFAGTELMYIVQSAADRKGTPAQMATYVYGLMSGDCTVAASAITCTKTNGTAFGTLATATPGTGVLTWVTTPTSANLAAALTDETGTGAAVFASGPTLAGTILGTYTLGGTPTIASGTFSTAATFSFITGSTQCLHVNTSGVLSGTGSDCGSGGGAVSSVTGGIGITVSPTTGAVVVSSPVTVRNNTATTDTITVSDKGTLITESNVSAVAVTITNTSFVATDYITVRNLNSGAATYTASSGNIDGGTLICSNGQSADLYFNGTNWVSLAKTCGLSVLATTTPGTGVATALGVNTGSAGAFVVNGGALGTPSSGTLTSATGLPISTGLTGAGTGVITAAGNNLSAAGGLTTTIGSGTKAMATSAISSAACTSAQTVTVTGTATTDVVLVGFNGDPTAITGFVPLTAGMLTVIAYPTADTVNIKECNNTSGSITPGAHTLNVRVVR